MNLTNLMLKLRREKRAGREAPEVAASTFVGSAAGGLPAPWSLKTVLLARREVP